MNNEFIAKHRAGIVLAGILVLSAFLNIWNLWNQGYSNSYYAAAVRSMLANPSVAFFGSFDAAGFITVDKPPVGLWVQAAFAAILGYNNWVLDLPQALAGVASVALIYVIVSRPFGKPAGLVSALALAITPIFVATARNETMDLQLIFVILLAIWAALKAAREKSFPYLAVATILIGIGFNIKMIQAFIVIPAVLAVYFFGTSIPFRKKSLHIVAAILILMIVSLSWAVVVDLIPAGQRPYIGSSGDNTVFGLIFGHNGIERLESTRGSGISGARGSFPSIGNMTGGPGGMMAAGQDLAGDPGQGSGADTVSRPSGVPDTSGQSIGQSGTGSPEFSTGNETGISGNSLPADQNRMMASTGSAPVGGNTTGQPGGGGMGGQGTPSAFRFYESDVADQISWLLPLALIGLLAWLRKPASFSLKGLEDAGLFREKGLTLMAMVLWLIPGLLYFSFTSGFWHTYYLATIAPPLAALTGIGIIGMYEGWRNEGSAGWLLVGAVLVTGLLEVRILLYDSAFAGLLLPGVLAGTVIVAILMIWLRKTGRHLSGKLPVVALLLALAVLFVAPFVWACTPIGYSGGDSLPTAGPQQGGVGVGGKQGGSMDPLSRTGTMNGPGNTLQEAVQGQMMTGSGSPPPGMGIETGRPDNSTISDGNRVETGAVGRQGEGVPRSGDGMGAPDSSASEELAGYLLSHISGETYLAATTGTHSAAGLIIATGKPVMALGGFLGSDQPLTLDEFKEEIKSGTVRYFIASGGGGSMGGGESNSAIVDWVESSCTTVTDLNGNGSTATTPLYDCAEAV